MDIYLIKGLDNKFTAVHDSDYEKVKKIKPNEAYLFKYSKPRNIGFHNKFFALLNLVFSNQEHYKNLEHLRKDLIISAGFYDTRYSFDGQEIIEAKSISFASMEEEEFQDLYNRVLDEIVKHFNFGKQDILDNVEQYF